MSKKIRVTSELIEKAKNVFTKSKKGSIITNEGLTRGELRALERKGYVKKMIIFGDRKFAETTGTQTYLWEWVK